MSTMTTAAGISTWADGVAIGGGIGGIVTAIIALFIAARANKAAKAGNSLAKVANDTAADALRQTKKANRIAVEANELAGNANTIAKRALNAAHDDVEYHWVLEIQADGLAVVINDCGQHAAHVAAIVDHGGEPVARSAPTDIDAFGKIALDVKGAVEQHFEKVRGNPVQYAVSDGGVNYGGRNGTPVHTKFRAHLTWLTPEQVPRSYVAEKVISHQMTHEGIKEFIPRPRRP